MVLGQSVVRVLPNFFIFFTHLSSYNYFGLELHK